MNEVEHFFDLEIKRAEGCIAHSEDFECFNGVKVGSKHAKELNQAHIRFCESAKRSLMPTIDKMDKQISEMQSHIDCLKAELEEIQKKNDLYVKITNHGIQFCKEKTKELPLEPVDVAAMLIKATVTCKANSIQKAFNCPDEYEADRYSKADLKEIAEHLLVYCNNAEEE